MLYQYSVAYQRRRDEEAQHLPERKIPGHDRENRPQRLINYAARRSGNGLRLDIRGALLGKMARAKGSLLYFAQRLAERLAHLQRDQPRVLFRALLQKIGQPSKKRRPLRERSTRPILPAVPDALQAKLNLLGTMLRICAEQFTGSGVSRFE